MTHRITGACRDAGPEIELEHLMATKKKSENVKIKKGPTQTPAVAALKAANDAEPPCAEATAAALKPVIAQLVAQGKKQGFITMDEIADAVGDEASAAVTD